MSDAGRVYAGWVFSAAFYAEGCYRDLGFPTLEEFLAGFWDGFFPRRDANDCLAMATTWQLADIGAGPEYGGDFEKALSSIAAEAIVMPGETDLMFTVEQCEYEVRHMPNAELRPIRSIWGHAAGVGFNPKDTEFLEANLRELLSR
jgi:homoserine O-acetyltransferase/O-succinyltransferase